MIKLGLKNYCKSFRLFFVPLGALALGVVLGLSVMLPWIAAAVKEFVGESAELLGSTSWDWNAVKPILLDAFQSLDWASPKALINEIFSEEYLTDLLRKCVTAALGDTSAIAEGMDELVTLTVGKIFLATAAGIGFSIIGAFLGFFVTKVEIRRGMAKRKLGRLLLVVIVHAVLKVTVLAAGAWLILKAEKFALLSGILTVLVYGGITFVEAYFSQGWRKIPFKKVMRIRNFFSLFLLTLLEIAIAAGLIFLIIVISNMVFGLFVGYSILIVTLICLSLNAEAYVKSLADERATDGVNNEAFADAYKNLAPNVHRDRHHGAAPLAVGKKEPTIEAAETPKREQMAPDAPPPAAAPAAETSPSAPEQTPPTDEPLPKE